MQSLEKSEESNEADGEPEQPEPHIKSTHEAIESIKNVQYFLRYHCHPYDLNSSVNRLTEPHAKTTVNYRLLSVMAMSGFQIGMNKSLPSYQLWIQLKKKKQFIMFKFRFLALFVSISL